MMSRFFITIATIWFYHIKRTVIIFTMNLRHKNREDIQNHLQCFKVQTSGFMIESVAFISIYIHRQFSVRKNGAQWQSTLSYHTKSRRYFVLIAVFFLSLYELIKTCESQLNTLFIMSQGRTMEKLCIKCVSEGFMSKAFEMKRKLFLMKIFCPSCVNIFWLHSDYILWAFMQLLLRSD